MILLRLTLLGLALLGAVAVNAPLQVGLRRFGFAGAADGLQIGLSRLLCAILGIRVRAQGRPPDGGALVVANHVSWTDILVLGSIAPLCFLAKSEVAAWPLLGAAVRAHGTLFVTRRRTRQLLQVNRDMAATMHDGRAVVLFAEGTTGNGTRIDAFHSGHLGAVRDLLRAEPARRTVPVVPAALAYTRRDGVPTGHLDRLALAWMGDAELLPHLLPLLRGGPVRCNLVFGEALAVGPADDRKQVCTEIRRRVSGIFSSLVTGREVAVADSPVFAEPAAIRSPMNPVLQPDLPSGSPS